MVSVLPGAQQLANHMNLAIRDPLPATWKALDALSDLNG